MRSSRVLDLDTMKAYVMCAQKSTENPMQRIKLIIDMESKWTPQNCMRPTTPTSMDTMARMMRGAQTGCGMMTMDNYEHGHESYTDVL